MRLAVLVFVLAHVPYVVGLRISPKRARVWLLLAPLIFVAIAGALFAAESAHLIKGVSPAHRPMRFFARMAYGFGFGFPAVAIAFAAARWRAGETTWRKAALFAAPCAFVSFCASWAVLIEPSQLAVRRYEVITARAPRTPLRILHVSDLQTDGACRRERLAETFAQGAEPDLVIFTGDLMNGDDPDEYPALISATHAFLASLHARLGVYGVIGDWDGWGKDWAEVLRAVTEGTSIRFLRNETVTLDAGDGTRLTLHGILEDDPRQSRVEHTDRIAGVELPSVASAGGARIVIAHSPDTLAFDTPVAANGADLLLAGHTHGGQVVLPFVGPLTTHSRLGFAGGRTDIRGMPLIVSRGIGMRGGGAPRVRFNCPPEVGWIELKR